MSSSKEHKRSIRKIQKKQGFFDGRFAPKSEELKNKYKREKLDFYEILEQYYEEE